MTSFIRISGLDNVAVAAAPAAKGETITAGSLRVAALEDIPMGHKIALTDIPRGAAVIKYGVPIGSASADIRAGEWVHTQNLQTRLAGRTEYTWHPGSAELPAAEPETFSGYLRTDGRAAVRNEIWILPVVGCVNGTAEQLAAMNQDLAGGSIDGIYAFPHPYGCSQLGEDHARTRRLLAALARHPNAGGVLILGLGCENLTLDQFRRELGRWDDRRVKFLVCQQAEDEFAAGSALLRELAVFASESKRQPLPVSKLVVGLKCGGSDGLSGITANPAAGAFSDLLAAQGGSTVLTETPEMFGAETLLMDRCRSEDVFRKTVRMINGFKAYYEDHHQVIYENPSPGNHAGGITTLEEKSLGCIRKSGTAPIAGVLDYGEALSAPGVNLLSGPGNDPVSTTALTAAGAQLILFTTGRGNPFGAPAPSIKVSSNTDLFRHKPNWIDFDAGTIAAGESIEACGARLFRHILRVAGGERTCSERMHCRGIAIFKDGVTL